MTGLMGKHPMISNGKDEEDDKKSPEEEAMDLAEDQAEGKIASKMLLLKSKSSGAGGAAAKALLSK